jgi:GDP-L-fucose synthase
VKILVAGATGLVGSAIARALDVARYEVVPVSTKNLDLTDREKTISFLCDVKPDAVIDAAAKVGGIGANNDFPVDFLSLNLQIQTNLMDAAHQANVSRFVFLGSNCIYPRDCPQPIKEEYLLTGPMEPTNSAYAVAKIAGIELIRAYRRQYGHKWISLMPINLYGPGDNFDLETSHVLPALIHRFVDANEKGLKSVTLWGTGRPLREFLHADDLADATLLALQNYDDEQILNIGTGSDLSIADLATLVAETVGYTGRINWDATKPDGTPRKILDISRLRVLGWSPKISLAEGIKQTVSWYRENRAKELGKV